jgi:retron-type reverse transcriptase
MRNCVNPNQVSLFDFTQNRGATERGGRKPHIVHVYDNIVSIENLLVSWQEFLRGKRKRKDVAKFSLTFIDSIIQLHRDLVEKTYRHGSYFAFKISDPKPRDIHKADLRDRIVHHAIYRIIYPFFDSKFIFDSYSCRKNKGTHRAIDRFREFGRKISYNNTRTAWVLKGDIKKFFANIDHEILINILKRHIDDMDTLLLLEKIIDSFNTDGKNGVGIPLGNLTSQLLVNIYMNEFDQFVKRKLKVKYYIRYADDFLILNENRLYLQELIPKLSDFLETKLKLFLHPKKFFIKTLASGVDFLGWVHFIYHRIPRTSTKRRILNRLQENESKETLTSYLGLLSHGNTYKLTQKIKLRSLRD